jgi:Kdo2-lipid IVA lauroyltransferase/acyltransferase
MKALDRAVSRLQYWVASGMIQLVRFMPYPVALILGRTIGILLWAVLPLRRKIVNIQMRAALGIDNPFDLVLKVFMNQGDILVDAIKYAYLNDSEIRKRIVVEGKEHLDEALSSGRGLLMFTGHIGNWEILSHASRLLDIEFCVMADVRKDEGLESVIDNIRARSGATILPPKGKALMLIKELKKGRSIGFVVDQRGKRQDGLLCDIFGLPAITNPAPAFIAIKGNALVMPVYTVKEDGIYHIRFHKAVDSSEFGQGKEAIQALSDFMQSWIASVVKRYPDQWFWLHSRWVRRSNFQKTIKSVEGFKTFISKQAEDIRRTLKKRVV